MGIQDQPDRPSEAEALAAIDSASRDRDRVVAHASAPWWYFGLCGLVCGIFVAAQILPPNISYVGFLVFLFGSLALGSLYKSLTGITLKLFKGRGLPYMIGAVAVLYLGVFASSAAAHSWNAIWVAIASSFAVVVVITSGGVRWQRQVARPFMAPPAAP
jgi:hypothetical protein